MHVLAIAAVAAALAGGEPDAPRVVLAVRAGLGAPVSSVTGGHDSMGPALERVVPLWAELGVQLTPAIGLAAYAQYAPGRTVNDACGTGCTASGHVLRAGLEALYRFGPADRVVPWVGAGAGYVSRETTLTLPPPLQRPGDPYVSSLGNPTFSQRGPEASAQLGLDVRVLDALAVGPYLTGFVSDESALEGGIRVRLEL